MNKNSLLLRATALLSLLLVPGSLWGQDRDRVFPLKGAAVTGKIVERNRDRIVIEVRGDRKNFPTNEVQRILFEKEPQSFSRTK
ncbi:MAG: hypothetical protein ACK6A7_23780, partial [Planctomycetota bacterium]